MKLISINYTDRGQQWVNRAALPLFTAVMLIVLFTSSTSQLLEAMESEYFIRGLTFYQDNQFELAAATFEEAKRVEPQNELVYFYLGNAYYQLNDLDNAIITYTAGLSYADNKGIFFYNLGNCYYLKGNYEFSTEMYDKALSHDPTLYDSYLNAGNAYYKAGNIEKTIFKWETYLEKYPETPQHENIERALAYLREELGYGEDSPSNVDETTGLDVDLLNEVMSDLDRLTNSTENIMEMSEKPVDDLSIEDIER
jgi:tetratricopeptide (TPR) repeat protein